MKCAELAGHIEAIGRLIEGLGGSSEPVRSLCSILGVMPQKTVVQIVKLLPSQMADEVAAPEVRRVMQFVQSVSAELKNTIKPAVVSDLSLLGGALGNVGSRSVEEVVGLLSAAQPQRSSLRASGSPAPTPELREDLVLRYYRLLEQTLGDDPGFAEAYRTVEVDKDMRVGELVALAKRFAFASVKSRNAALKKILGRHQALMTSRAKTQATGGRLAG